jgi:hypothetical protein
MADQAFAKGQAVSVFDTPFLRAENQFHGASYPSRPATIAHVLADEAGTYEVSYTDGAEPASAYVTSDVLLAV